MKHNLSQNIYNCSAVAIIDDTPKSDNANVQQLASAQWGRQCKIPSTQDHFMIEFNDQIFGLINAVHVATGVESVI